VVISGILAYILPSTINYITKSATKYVLKDSHANYVSNLVGNVGGSVIFPIMVGVTIYFAEGLIEGDDRFDIWNKNIDFSDIRPFASFYFLSDILSREVMSGILNLDLNHLNKTITLLDDFPYYIVPKILLPLMGAVLGAYEDPAKAIFEDSYNLFQEVIKLIGNDNYNAEFVIA
jgi:hypothetical protein